MGSGASHESATAAVAAGVSEEEVAAHLASLDKKPCTVYYSPFSNNSMGAAMTATACGCAELKLVDLAGEQKSEAYLQINPYGQARDPCHPFSRHRAAASTAYRARTGSRPHRRQQRTEARREPRDPQVPRHAVQAVFVSRQSSEPRED